MNHDNSQQLYDDHDEELLAGQSKLSIKKNHMYTRKVRNIPGRLKTKFTIGKISKEEQTIYF